MMSDGIYLDNDVVLKMCTYLAPKELLEVTSTSGGRPAILGLAKFTLRSRVQRSRVINKKAAVVNALEATLEEARQLEPTSEEIEAAADLEERAIRAGLPLDLGESQLVAMMLNRSADALVTGDKRAIRALAVLAPVEVERRLACFEQLVAAIVRKFGADGIRAKICAERQCDKAITASFSCSSRSLSIDEAMDGLRSYIGSLRGESGDLLLCSDDLSAIVS